MALQVAENPLHLNIHHWLQAQPEASWNATASALPGTPSRMRLRSMAFQAAANPLHLNARNNGCKRQESTPGKRQILPATMEASGIW
jgi:hypothetical protein